MTTRGIGVTLVWLGTLALVAVLQHRVRRGAWRIGDAQAPPVGRWAPAIAGCGILAALAGTALAVWNPD